MILRNINFHYARMLLLYMILLIPVIRLNGETIILRSGKTLHGKVLGQNSNSVRVETKTGIKVVSKRSIVKVIYQDISDSEAKNILIREIQREQKAKVKIKKTKPLLKEQKVLPEKSEALEEEPVQNRSRYDIVWRSAVLPGWGEIHAGNDRIGWMDAGVFWASALTAAFLNRESQREKHSYDKNSGLLHPYSLAFLSQHFASLNQSFAVTYTNALRIQNSNRHFSHYKHAVSNYNTSLGILAGLYILNLVHSYFTGIQYENKDSKDSLKVSTSIRRIPAFPSQMQGGREVVYSVSYEMYF